MSNCFNTRFLDWIGYGNDARGAPIECDEYHRMSLFLKLTRFWLKRLDSTHILPAQKLRLADEHFAPVHFTDYTTARCRLKICHLRKREILILRATHDGCRKRVLALLLD